MRAAPAFELSFRLGIVEHCLLAGLGAVVAAALAGWMWSHIDAAAGLAGRGALLWVAVAAGAAIVGLAIGWFAAPRMSGTLHWQQGQWSLRQAGQAQAMDGSLEATLDLGSWMLLRFCAASGRACWLTAKRRAAGSAWHALRATLYAPGGTTPDAEGGAST